MKGWIGAAALAATLLAEPAIAAHDLRAEVVAASQAAMSRWQVHSEVRIGEEGTIRSLGGRVEIGLAALRAALASLPEARSALVTRWVVSHEFWHEAQFARGMTAVGLSDDVVRQRECEADIMAAYGVVGEELAGTTAQTSEVQAQAIAANIGGMIKVAQKLEAGAEGVLNHPSPAQRRAAIRIGVGRALAENYLHLAAEPERGAIRDRLIGAYDIQAGEEPAAWSVRSCGALLHNGDGIGDLALGTASIVWSKSADAPFVDYSLPYRNVGTVPLHIKLQVRAFAVPREARDDFDRAVLADFRIHDVVIAAKQSATITGRLQWIATDTLMPRLVFPPNAESLYDAQRLAADAPQNPAPLTRTSALSADETALKEAMDTLTTQAGFAFSGSLGRCEINGNERSCKLLVAIPLVQEASVDFEGNGSSEVTLWVYRGRDETEAKSAFARFRDAMRIVYPAAQYRERTREGGLRSIYMKPTRDTKFSMSELAPREGRYSVIGTFEPDAFGGD